MLQPFVPSECVLMKSIPPVSRITTVTYRPEQRDGSVHMRGGADAHGSRRVMASSAESQGALNGACATVSSTLNAMNNRWTGLPESRAGGETSWGHDAHPRSRGGSSREFLRILERAANTDQALVTRARRRMEEGDRDWHPWRGGKPK